MPDVILDGEVPERFSRHPGERKPELDVGILSASGPVVELVKPVDGHEVLFCDGEIAPEHSPDRSQQKAPEEPAWHPDPILHAERPAGQTIKDFPPAEFLKFARFNRPDRQFFRPPFTRFDTPPQQHAMGFTFVPVIEKEMMRGKTVTVYEDQMFAA
jgi:hypothetical protein